MPMRLEAKPLGDFKDLNLNPMGNRKSPIGLCVSSLGEVLRTSRRPCSHVGGCLCGVGGHDPVQPGNQ